MHLQTRRPYVTGTVSGRKTESEITGESVKLRVRLSRRENVAGSKTGVTSVRRISADGRSGTGTVTAADLTTCGCQTGTDTVWSAAEALTARTGVAAVSCTDG